VRAGKRSPEEYLYDWNRWAEEAQTPPAGDWRIWLFMGGRGAGKTRAGAEWVRAQVAAGARRVALVGPAFQDVREVMLGGPSGLLSIGYPHERPSYEVSRRRVVWPGGAVGYAFSAEDPDGLRGPQFDAAWADEFAAWARPQETLDMLRLGLRLGSDPRLVITTTPRPIPAVKALINAPGVVMTRLSTWENRSNLAPGFVEAMEAQYAGSHLARQELDGVLVEDPEGALWTRAMIELALRAERFEPDRIVVESDEGWEVLSFEHAVLTGPESWRLTGLLRGLGGSPVAGAQAGARVVVLDGAGAVIPVSADERGAPLRVIAAPPGAPLTGPAARIVETVYGGADLRPLAPVHARARVRSGALEARWTRRGRIDADAWSAEIPLGEESERYAVTLLNAGGDEIWQGETAQPKLTLDAVALAAALPGGADGARLRVAQVSAVYGPGQAREVALA